MSFTVAGGFGLFFYPPTFAPMILPFAYLSAETATWVWIAVSLVAFLVGVAVLPASRSVRWWILLLAGLSFPFVFAIKLGQVGPILFLAFAVGWRGIDDPVRLGGSAALGAAIKLQPGLLLVWALLTRRFRAVVVGAGVLLALAGAATLLAGPTAWSDFFVLIRTVSDPIATDRNVTPGAVAYQLGAPMSVATVIQLVNTIAVVAAFLAAIRWAGDEASYLVAVIASQLISPILWDHYAMLLLLPVAYLLSAGRWWALHPARDGLAADRRHAASRVSDRLLADPRRHAAGRPGRPATARGHDRHLRYPDHGMTERPWRRVVVGSAVVGICALLYWLANRNFDAGRGDLFYLADAFLHGHAWLDVRLGPNDVILAGDHYYVPFAPFPAVALIPIVVLVGPVTADQLESGINAVLAASGVGMCWWLLGRVGVERLSDRLWLVVLFGFSTRSCG